MSMNILHVCPIFSYSAVIQLVDTLQYVMTKCQKTVHARPRLRMFKQFVQVVVKTQNDYQTEQKSKVKLKVPKMEELTISLTDGVSERLKV